MQNQPLLDDEQPEDWDSRIKMQRKTQISAIAILILVNSVVFTIYQNPKFEVQFLMFSLVMNAFFINFLGFLLGTIFAAIPYKGLTYEKKYVRASLLTILSFQIFQCALLVTTGILMKLK